MTKGAKADVATRLGGTAKAAWWRGDHKQGKTDDLRKPGSEARSIGLTARPSVAGALALAASNASRTPRTARLATDLSRCAEATLHLVALGSFPEPDPMRPRGSRNHSSKTPPKSRLTGLTLIVGVDGAGAAQ
jgi:hypothetical protein